MLPLNLTVEAVDSAAVEDTGALMERIATMSPQELWETYRWPLLSAAALVVIAYFVIRLITAAAAKGLRKSRLDKSAHRMILSTLRILLWLAVALTAAAMLGIPVTSSLALFSVFALAVSLAVKDGLSHFAGGIMILASKPFTVGDFIESKADGVSGTVEEVGLIHTKLRTFDNKRVYIPNGVLVASTVINYTGAGTRRLDLTFTIAYSEDFRRAESIIATVAAGIPGILTDREPVIRVAELAPSGVDIICRVWVGKESYEAVKFDLLEGVKAAFDEKGVEIPYPQLDVHIKDTAR